MLGRGGGCWGVGVDAGGDVGEGGRGMLGSRGGCWGVGVDVGE